MFSHPPIRSIPDFAREADFLRLLPRGADIDPNDPRHGNVMRMRGLLAALGLGRRESSVVAHGGGGGRVAVAGLGLAKEGVGGPVGIGGGGGDEEEEAGVFRASQEQQALVFLGKRVAKGSAGAAGRGGDGTATGGSASRGGSGGAFHTFAYNNHRRREEAGWFGCLAATYRCVGVVVSVALSREPRGVSRSNWGERKERGKHKQKPRLGDLQHKQRKDTTAATLSRHPCKPQSELFMYFEA